MVSKTESFVVAETNLRTEANKSDIDIKDLIKDMPEKYKVLVAKMFLEGYTQQEIADEMGIPLGTVKTRLREAIKMLRESLKDEKHLLYMLLIM